jgi:FdhE protein
MQTQPIDFHPPAEEAAPILLPVTTTLFADRADRFASLASGHALADWLNFLGALSRAQHDALKALPALPLPDAAALDQARQHGMPPLDLAKRPAAWRDSLRQIARSAQDAAPATIQADLAKLIAADDDALEKLADALMQGAITPSDALHIPFVAAALQVVFTDQASRIDASQINKFEQHNICPCCGSPAVASIVRLGAAINNLRYLHCSVCNTEWNVPRAVCTSCGTDKDVAQQEIDGKQGAARAETCDGCKSYLKIVYQEKDPRVDPVADDLASLALDLLVDEAGYERAGPNLFLIHAPAT